MKILIVDDEPDVVEVLQLTFNLQWPACGVISASRGGEALVLFAQEQPDVVILDLGLPDMSGFEVCRRLRETSEVPIVILTVKGDEMSKIKGLEMGADDYVTKPFSALELVARIRAIMRRVEMPLPTAAGSSFVSGDLRVDFASREITLKGHPVRLTPTEYSLLFHLVCNAGRVLPHGTLLAKVWGREYRDDVDCLKVHIARLREKLGDSPQSPRYITTERGLGYRFIKPQGG